MSKEQYLEMMESLRKSASLFNHESGRFELTIIMDLYTTLVHEYTAMVDRGLFA